MFPTAGRPRPVGRGRQCGQEAGRDKEGKSFERLSRFTNVWVLKDGAWQCVSGHASAIPATPQGDVFQVVADRHLGVPQSTADAFSLLERSGLIDPPLAAALYELLGFRNVGGFKGVNGVIVMADGVEPQMDGEIDCGSLHSDNFLLTWHLKGADFFNVKKHPT